LAADYIRRLGGTPEKLEELNDLLAARPPADAKLAGTIAQLVKPAYMFGHDAVYAEYNKFLVQPMDSPWQDPPTGFQPNNYPARALDQPDVWPQPVGTRVYTPVPAPEMQTSWGAGISAIGKRGAFDFAAWTLSREMSQLPDDAFPVELDDQEYNIESDMLQNCIANNGAPLHALSREIVQVAVCEGRKQAIKELREHVGAIGLQEGLWKAEWI
jgi:hypothetical protein